MSELERRDLLPKFGVEDERPYIALQIGSLVSTEEEIISPYERGHGLLRIHLDRISS